jgi:hypothetical protein
LRCAPLASTLKLSFTPPFIADHRHAGTMAKKQWVPLESNPDVLNEYAGALGLVPGTEFTDVFGLDDVRHRRRTRCMHARGPWEHGDVGPVGWAA